MASERLDRAQFQDRLAQASRDRERALAELTERLHHYEKKYGMRSEAFYQLIVGTPADDTPDFIDWAVSYRSYFRALRGQLSPEGAVPGGDLPDGMGTSNR